jgi:hypothetical protein
MFPAWEVVHHDAWVNAAWGYSSTIHINGYAGTLMRSDVQAALEDAIMAVTDPVTFSGVQEMIIDGRTAWGWAERLQVDEVGLAWIGYRVAVPYDTITYTIELFSGDPDLKGVPDTLLVIAATFGIGETTWNVPLIVGLFVVLVIVIFTIQKRSKAKQLRLQSITLKKVEIKEGEEEGEKEASSDTPKTGAPPVFTPSKPEPEKPAPPAVEKPPEGEG